MKRALAILFCLCFAATAQGQNWSSFRGNGASGVADTQNVPATWDAPQSINKK